MKVDGYLFLFLGFETTFMPHGSYTDNEVSCLENPNKIAMRLQQNLEEEIVCNRW